ncbi:MAG TPA: T9SS type A sorting domain-containing protein [Flavobacterium sp.]|uniref:T9SS type A sorting domain-containing protein n=1 Tax=Flavobacterium sp. TaxID=239 RepID=UPI002C8357B7|nr:T9SS type A sorting domain-containing protein [Flavobacterium sp.]HNP32517.1 T9SS type A sorting domain-containing protein [Flavobacterium sp.]
MKKAITFLTILLTFGFTQAQAPAIEWQKSLGGTNTDEARCIQLTSDGGYIVAGDSNSINVNVTGNHGGPDYWVVKLDANRNIQWQKSFGGTSTDIANSIQNTPDGGYIVAGQSNSNNGDVTANHGGIDYWIVKLDVTGTIQWQKSLGGSGNDVANAIQITTDNGYVVAGYSQSDDGDVTGHHGVSGQADIWIVKLDATGNVLWQKSLGGSGDDNANAIQNTSDGGYIVAGSTNSFEGDITENHGSYDYWVVKLDAVGTIQWQKSIGAWGNDYASAIQTTSDSGYIVAGSSTSIYGTNTGTRADYDYWVVKLDDVGTIQWQRSIGYPDQDYANTIQTTSDGGYIVTGSSYANSGATTGNHGLWDYWVIKLDNSGTLQWQKFLGGSDYDFAFSILTASDGGYIVAGTSLSSDYDITGNIHGYDCWIVKLASEALSAPAFENNALVIYPNPVCDILQIQTSKNTIITGFKMTDILGKVIIEQNQNSNTINVENLTQGVYILNAYSGEKKYAAKFVKE